MSGKRYALYSFPFIILIRPISKIIMKQAFNY